MKKWFLLTIAIVPLFFTGCTTAAIKSGYIISAKERFFGIVVAQGANQVPEVKLGFGSVVYMMIPTSTNGPINAPRFIDTFEIDQGLNPFGFKVVENTGAGDVAIGTNSTGTAIVPKLAPRVSTNSVQTPKAESSK